MFKKGVSMGNRHEFLLVRVKKGCQMKCDEEGENCNTIAVGDGTYGGGAYNYITYKNCALSAPEQVVIGPEVQEQLEETMNIIKKTRHKTSMMKK